MAERRIRGAAPKQPQRAVRILADALEHRSLQLQVRSDNPALQVNELRDSNHPEPTSLVGNDVLRTPERNTRGHVPGDKSNTIESVNISGN